MEVSLKDIDETNWIQCIFLTTDTDNKHYLQEEFVASNAVSIAQSKIEKGWITKAIYSDDTMVGFTMYGFSKEDQCFEICRIMIDHKFQRKGYGRKAINLVVREMSKIKECTEIYISFEPENHSAKKLYDEVGFINTGKMLDDEILYCLKI
ncbi:GNAT family N-acetyltransferase [Paenibacillus pini]|uniref:Spermine/spermidine acetyltransferase n=1 Tax=Paenibacillus pini JCM 16418 TaxID=1236976 RepID=W7Y9S6_9BACL|nr:GNAT family N-acetyltransferase [Paenibacillus pini]GAF07790.1 spermine/spermidine acetyltransferase [Paenibacillus pini JCM 16418]